MVNTVNILFGDNQKQGLPSSPEPVNEPNIANPTMQKEQKSGGKNIVAGIVGMQIAKTSFNYASNRVGEWTGNTSMQRTIDNTGKIATYGIAFAINPILGATTLIADTGMNLGNFYFSRYKENLGLSVGKQRAGYTVNRSR